MASSSLIENGWQGMEGITAHASSLGKTAHAPFGTAPTSSSLPCDEKECLRLEVHLPLPHGTLDIPYGVLASVSGRTPSMSRSQLQTRSCGIGDPTGSQLTRRTMTLAVSFGRI